MRLLQRLDASPHLRGLVLAGILAVALVLRLHGIDWDSGFFFHPDERFILLLKLPELGSLTQFDLARALDPATSPWNPRWFAYGSFPFYVLRTLLDAAQALDPAFRLDQLRFVGRSLSALADCGTIALCYWLGSRLYGWRVGMLGALLLAFAVLHIQLSHFATFDVQLTFWVMVVLAGCALALDRPRPLSWTIAGVGLGLALATKVSVLGLVAPVLVAHALYAFTQRDGTLALRWSPDRWRAAVVGVLATGVIGGVVLLVAQPYMLLDWPSFLRDTREQTEMGLRVRDLPYTRQYVDTPPYWYQVTQLAAWGFGWPLGLVAWAGVAFAVVRAGAARHRGDLLLLSWVLPYFLVTGLFPVKFMRYVLPFTPLLALFGARLLVAWQARAALASAQQPAAAVLQPARLYALGGPLAGGLRAGSLPRLALAAVVALTAWYALAFSAIYLQPHTALRASDWLRANAPAGALVLREHWEEGIPRLEAYPQRELPLYEPDTPEKLETLAQSLASAEYVVFYSDRLYGTIPRLPERYPMSSAYYRLLFSGQLGYELAHAEATYPSLLGVTWANDTFVRPGLPQPEGLHPPPGLLVQRGHADESFSVYDHPLVLVFRNTHTLDAAAIRARLAPHLPQSAPRPEGLVYPRDLWAAQQAGGTWSQIFDREAWPNRVPVLAWLLAVEALALLALPVALWLFRAFPDRGVGLTPMLGLVAAGWLVWLAASLQLLPFTRGTVLVVLGDLAALAGLACWVWRKAVWAALRQAWRPMVASHGVFLLAFGAFLLLRMQNPDLWHPARGGEKPMDFAYLNAIVRSTSMPAYDPWYAGGYLNYYYFGHFLVALLIKLTGIVPAVAYNLAVPLLFACTVAGAFSACGALAAAARPATVSAGLWRLAAAAGRQPAGAGDRLRRWWPAAGLTAGLGVAVAGNLDGGAQVMERLRQAGGLTLQSAAPLLAGALEAAAGLVKVATGTPLQPLDYWRSRGMGDMDRAFLDPASGNPSPTIVEFPYFTFLFADLHAHLIALPMAVLAVGLAVRFVATESDGWRRVAGLALCGLTLGALRWTNSWDYPAYLALTVATLAITELWRRPALGALLRAGAQALAVLGVSLLLFWPFQVHYQLFYGGGVLPSPERTPPELYFRIHGLFLAAVGSLAVYQGWRWLAASGLVRGLLLVGLARDIPHGARLVGRLAPRVAAGLWVTATVLAAAVLLAGSVALFAGATAGLVTLGLASVTALALAEFRERREGPAYLLVLAAAGLGLALTLVVEIVKLDIPGEVQRMNNVFKLYLQAWVLFAVAAAYAFWWVAARVLTPGWLRRWPPRLWAGGMAVLVAGALAYPLLATPVRLNDRFAPLRPGLDGAAFMATAVYQDQHGPVELRWDAEAIRWLQDNAQGSPVIAEAQTPLYRWGGRVSVHTGLPSILGWDWHQSQQRWDYRPFIEQRKRDVNQLYTSPDPGAAQAVLGRYGVRYLYVGPLERLYYPPAGLAKFEQMAAAGALREVYRNPQVTIYEVVARTAGA